MFLKHIKTDIKFKISTGALYAFLFFLFLFNSLFTNAVVKNIGIPTIQNYPRSEYNAGTQNWGAEQGTNGVMYFGNNNGLIRFDGQFWDLHLVPNGSNIRVLHFSENQQLLYAGAYDEFGYFENDSVGRLVYHSLLPLVAEEDLNFGDVWKIYEGSWGIVFQTFEGLFFYKDGKIEVVKPRSDFHFSYYVNGILYVFDRENGLLEYRNGFLKKIPSGSFFKRKEVWSMLPLNNDEILIGTAKEGLFHYDGMNLKPWDTPVNELLKQYQIYSSLIVDGDHLAFGTIQNGLIICNKQGEVVQIVNRKKGLQNNTVLSMCLDLDGNLWLGLDNGIDYVEINSPVTLLQDYYDFGTGYTSILYKNTIYLGTNQGLFYCHKDKLSDPFLNSTDFKMVPNTSGQVWSLQVINGKLFCGHNNGAFLIENKVGTQFNEIPGCWAFHEVPGYPGRYIEGTYNGLELCTFENGTLKHDKHIPGINYSCQELAIVPDRYVWVSHAFKGISLFRLNENLDSLQFVKLFTKEDGLPGDYFNEIKLMKNGTLLATTSEGIYQFDFRSNMFIRSAYYNNLFQNKTVSYIQEDDAGNIWYICSNNEGGVLRFQEDGTYTNVTYPFYKLKGKFIGSFFHFNVLDNNNVLIALEKGFAHYNPSLVINYRRKYNAVLNSASYLNQNDLIYSGLRVGNQQKNMFSPEIDFKNNSLRFTFSGLFFEGNNETMFSYKMEGFDHDWSEWQSGPVKEYTNLPDGDFTFRVRVKNKYGVIASPEAFHFTVLPPWYKSMPALLIYFAFFVILIWLIVLLFVKRVERTRLKEMDLQKRRYLEKEGKLKNEALLAEKEIIRLRNEKLRAEMIHKDKELANSAMNLVQKNKHLNKIKSELLKMKGEIKEDLLISRINMIIRKIDKETSNDESWSVFETNFEQVHEDFLKRLREKHPDITPKELKLSAYLRMNISSKEIATLLNITTRGVEISRYRLRRKFGLERNQNLIDYILSI
jgi:ligand-binding sensor domain-containing protein/DNA-binding CsgD family transcriptional regulator